VLCEGMCFQSQLEDFFRVLLHSCLQCHLTCYPPLLLVFRMC